MRRWETLTHDSTSVDVPNDPAISVIFCWSLLLDVSDHPIHHIHHYLQHDVLTPDSWTFSENLEDGDAPRSR
jgi:hypothetical protein